MTSLPPLLGRLLPFLAWRRQWSAASLRGDLIAGITVALMMIPQSLAYAQLASLPPHVGLYAALLPAIVAALFGSCAQLSTGPVALTSILTGASLLPFADPASPAFLTLAILLALLSGFIQLALGALRAGWLLNLLSRPVMTGFINAAALIIGLSQLPALLGVVMPQSTHFLVDFWTALGALGTAHPLSAAFGAGSLLALLLLRRFAPRFPAVLIVVACATATSAAVGYGSRGGAVVGAIPAGLPVLGVPEFDWNAAVALIPAAFVIALVSFMEATSSAKLISGKSGQDWDQNQELIGQGLAKLTAAISGALPVSASFSRSALNYVSGARSGLSSLFAAACVLVTLLYLTPLLWHLPKAVLAAIILHVITGLIDFRALARAWQAGRDDGLASTLTFVGTLVFAPNIQNGVLAGLLLSLALMLYREMRPRTALLGLHPDGTYRDLARFGLEHPDPAIVILRFDSPLTFVTAAAFERAVLAAAATHSGVHTVLISAAGINTIDATGLHTLSLLIERLRGTNRNLAFCGLKKQVIDVMQKTGLWLRLGSHADYRTEHQALEALRQDAPEVAPKR
ncbi:sulfate permease [Azoarcus sp. PA01]|nr:sulfate permease [Azoarcus sp. PA01]